MKLHELQPSDNSKKNRKRVGRGPGSGHGKTSCKGHKGQNARSGGGVRPGFEGGQMPLHRRLPKRGFKNYPFRKVYSIVNLSDLEMFEGVNDITPQLMIERGLVKKGNRGIKILAKGELKKEYTITADKFSKSAVEKIEAAGGKTVVIGSK